jgi:hypothetical protein
MENPERRGSLRVGPLQLNSRERLEVYRRLCLLNSSFSSIVQVLDELAQTRIFSAGDLSKMRGHAQEVQLEINTKLLPSLEPAELNGHANFGTDRTAMEKPQTQGQAGRAKAQASPIHILLTIVAVFNILLLIASLFVKPGPDWVYYSQDGTPAPCPPPNRGLFPRDCH